MVIENINEYFNHLKNELDGISPGHIYSYKKTNLADDPECKKCIL